MNGINHTNKDVANYYTSSQWVYRYFCYDRESLGMHFGFWDKTTKNRQEAISRENDYLINMAGIKKDMKILDAGCGVGGTVLDIAKKTGAKTWGITITPTQVALAKKYAKDKGVEDLVTFSVQDYSHTKFVDNFFDVVVGIESICHASPKSTFLKEAYRILKPGGKLVVADGYLARSPRNEKERKIVEDFKWAFTLNEFISGDEMTSQVKNAGFIKVKSKDMLQEVDPSISYYRKLAKMTQVFCLVAKYIPIESIKAIYKNYIALRAVGDGYEIGLAAYNIHLAIKPLSSGK